MFRNKILLIGLLSILLFSYCSENITESTPVENNNNNTLEVLSKFSEIQSKVFNTSCALSGCHVSGATSPNLSANSHSRIVNINSSTGIDLIKPNDPSGSYLLQKIIGSNGISGTRMPRGASPLSQAIIDSITVWINGGALNN